MSAARGSRLAAGLLAVAARLVPADRRGDWQEEWRAELWQVAREGGRSPAGFCLGAVRHALWLRRREWTMDLVFGDVRQALRGLRRTPGFVVASALTLALGIGANATVFSMLNGLALRAPPGIASPDRLVQLGRGATPADFDAWSYLHVADLRAGTGDVFDGLAAWSDTRGILGTGVGARAVAVQVVSGEYFDVLGVRPAAGRLLRPEDDGAPGARAVLVLSHALWQSAWAGDPAIVNGEVTLNGRAWEVVGVAPPGFAGTDPLRAAPAAWAPLAMQASLTGRADAALEHRGNSWLWAFARLRSGVDPARAEAATRAAHLRIADAHPEFSERGILFVEGVGARPADRAEVLRLGALLMATMLIVLWIACANLAGLALARGAARRGEMAVRTALGARRGRIVRQLMAESILVAVPGTVLAIGLAAALSTALPGIMPVPVAVDFTPDTRVLGFTALVAGLAVLAFGVAPALATSQADPIAALRTSGVGRGAGAASGRLRGALVVGQVAFAFVLLAGATLLVRSVRHAYRADPGFRTAGVLAVTLDIGRSLDLDAPGRAALRARLAERLAQLPGVTSTGTATVLPIAEPQPSRTPLAPGELPTRPAGPPPPPVYTNTVDGGYFRTLGLRTVAGRTFDESADGATDAPVIVVNERFATRFFPDGDAIGATVSWAGDGAPATIVGIVADAPVRTLGEAPPPVLYTPAARRNADAYHLLVSVRVDDAATRRAIAEAIAGVEPGLPVLRIESLDRLVGASLAQTRLTAATAGAAGALALGLAVIGLYGVIACAVADRRREFGLRSALGARGRDVIGLVMRQAAVLAGSGIGLGILLALPGLGLLDRLLFGVPARDPLTLVLIALALAATTLVASAIPAVRAARADPVRTLGAG